MLSDNKKEDNIQDLKISAQNFKDVAGRAANDAKDDLSSKANKLGHKVRGFIDTAGDDIAQVSDNVTKEIRSNPVQSSLIALGVGLVFGLLISR